MEQLRDFWVRAALALAIALPFYFFAAALGERLELFDWRFASETMTQRWGEPLVLGVLAFAVAGLVLAFFVAPQRGRRIAVLALLSPTVLAAIGFEHMRAEANAAPISDISTDLIDPPAFTQAVHDARAGVAGANALDLATEKTPDGRSFADVQRHAYPNIASIPTGLAPLQAFDIAEKLAREQNWRITMSDARTGRIEATRETLWFGFIDDIAVRVRADGSGARVDMRASRRVGANDAGENVRRVQAFLTELRRRLQETESR